MMNEILKNGPIATSLKVDYGFRLYKKGIYQSDEKETWAIK
jgi:hypothetical protein